MKKKTEQVLKSLKGRYVGAFWDDSTYRRTMKLLEAIKPSVSIKKKNLKYIQKGEDVVEDKGKEIIFAGYEENMVWELRQCKQLIRRFYICKIFIVRVLYKFQM